jgi:hypothetical protein
MQGAKVMDWSPDAIRVLTELWNCNTMSASEIAIIMGITRNSVIGKAHRLQLVNKDGRKAVAYKPKIKPKRKKRMRSPQPPQPLPEPELAPAPVEYLDLKHWHCRAIVDGIGSDGLVLSCGRRKLDGSSYCGMHTRKYLACFHDRDQRIGPPIPF